jgi:hypothetical protein
MLNGPVVPVTGTTRAFIPASRSEHLTCGQGTVRRAAGLRLKKPGTAARGCLGRRLSRQLRGQREHSDLARQVLSLGCLASGGAFGHVTVAEARLTPHNAVTEIDRLITTAWREKLPVYMELPSDIAYLDIEVPTAPLVLAEPWQ